MTGFSTTNAECFLEYLDHEISKMVHNGETVVVTGLVGIRPSNGRVYLTSSETFRAAGVSVRVVRDPRLARKVLQGVVADAG